MKSHQLAAALAAILALVQSHGLAQDNVQAAIVIRSDPSLMSLTPEALSALPSPQRLLVVADSSGTPLSAFVLRDDAPQPPGVWVRAWPSHATSQPSSSVSPSQSLSSPSHSSGWGSPA